MKLSDIRIGTKLMLVIGVLSLATVAVSGTGIFAVSTLGTDAGEISAAAAESVAAARMSQSVIELNRSQYSIAADASPQSVAQARSDIDTSSANFTRLFAQVLASAEETQRRLLEAAQADYNEYEQTLQETLTTADRLGSDITMSEAQQAIKRAVDSSHAAGQKLRASIRAYVDYTVDQKDTIAAEAALSAATLRLVMIVVAAVGVFGGAILGFLLARFQVSKPLTESITVLNRLAKEDTSADITGTDRMDEIGDIAKAMETFKENLIQTRRLQREAEESKQQAAEERRKAMLELADRFESRIGSVVNVVSSAAQELQATSQQLAAAVEETGAQSTAIAAASEQASANVQTVASAAEELSTAIQEVSQQVSSAARLSNAATDVGQAASRELDQLTVAVEQVTQVVAAISDVADQTNLLALNATIEAARAGEAGKGFAVVASEVKNLATQTQKMTEQIGGQIAGVQRSSANAVEAMRNVIRQISEIDQAATAVAASVEQQNAATGEISRNAQQASVGTQEVATNIVGVQTASRQTGEASTHVKEASFDLAKNAESLRKEVEDFLGEVRAA